MHRMIAVAFVITTAAAQTSNTPVTLAFHGIGSSDGNGGFTLNGAGTFSPYGGAQISVTSLIIKDALNANVQFAFNDGFQLSALGPVMSNDAGISGTVPFSAVIANGIVNAGGTFSFSATPSFTAKSNNTEFTLTGSGTLTLPTGATRTQLIAEKFGGYSYPVSVPGGAGYPLTAGGGGSPVLCVRFPSVLVGEGCSAMIFYGASGYITRSSVFAGSGGSPNALLFEDSVGLPATAPWVTYYGSGSKGGVVVVFDGSSEAGSTLTFNIATPTQPIQTSYTASASCLGGESAGCFISIPEMAASGSIGEPSAAAFPATVNAQWLHPGVYQATVGVQLTPSGGAASTLNIPVTLVIISPQPLLALSQTGLQYQGIDTTDAYQQILQQFVTVSNFGPGSLSFSATASTLSGGNWLYVWPTSGSVAQAGAGQVVNVQANPAGLSPGLYLGRVDFTAPGAANAPQSVEVALNVPPITSSLTPLVSPSSIVFVEPEGGSRDNNTLGIVNITDGPLEYEAKFSFDQGNKWITLSSSGLNVSRTCSISGPIVPCAPEPYPETLTVTPPFQAGVLLGNLDLNFAKANQDIPVPVVLVVQAPAASNAPACVPTQLLPTFTNLSSGFQLEGGIPVPIQVQVVDDCGSPLVSGGVMAFFPGSEDPPVSMAPLGNGQWTGAWMPHNIAGTQASIGVIASSFAPPLYGSAGLVGHLAANSSVPVVVPGGVVSAASLAANQPLAPGGSISIFGSNLAPDSTFASSLPLQTTLAGTQVLIGNQPLLLTYAGPKQINAVLPYGVPVNSVQQLTVVRNGTYSLPETVVIAQAQPAVFTQNQSGTGAGVIMVAKSSGTQFLNTPAMPATASDTLVIYCAGLGAVTPAVPDGSAAPSSPPAETTNPVTVTIGGKAAPVSFAGLAPGFTGLYQVNAVVPQGIATSSAVPLILTVAGAASTPVTVAIQ